MWESLEIRKRLTKKEKDPRTKIHRRRKQTVRGLTSITFSPKEPNREPVLHGSTVLDSAEFKVFNPSWKMVLLGDVLRVHPKLKL